MQIELSLLASIKIELSWSEINLILKREEGGQIVGKRDVMGEELASHCCL